MHVLSLIPWFRLPPLPVSLPWGLSFKVQPFGVWAALAMLVCSHFAAQRGRQLHVPERLLSEFLSRVTFVGVASAYVLNIVLYAPEYVPQIIARPSLLLTHWFGLSSFGGFIGGALAAWHFAHARRVSLLRLGDAWCFSFPFAWFFARMGCFCVHDHPGVASHFLLAVDNWEGSGIARHDLGLYEVLWSVPVALAFWLGRRKHPPAGHYLALLCSLYGPVRFALDFLRTDAANGGDVRYLGLTPAQYGSLALTAFGLLFTLCSRSQRRDPRVLLFPVMVSIGCGGAADDPVADAHVGVGDISSATCTASRVCTLR